MKLYGHGKQLGIKILQRNTKILTLLIIILDMAIFSLFIIFQLQQYSKTVRY